MNKRHTRIAATGFGSLCIVSLLALSQDPDREPVFRGEPLQAWLPRLNDLDPDVQNVAAFAVGRFGPKASLAVPDLIRMMREGETTRNITPLQSNAAAAAEALGRIRITTPEVIAVLGLQATRPALISRVHREEARAAIVALGELGARAADGVPALIKVLERPLRADVSPLDGVTPLQHDAAKSLGMIGPAAAEALPALQSVAKTTEDLLLSIAAREAAEKIEGKQR